LGERVLCKHEVVGSIPSGSTSRRRQPSGFQPFGYPRGIVLKQGFAFARTGLSFEHGKRVFCHRKEEIHPIAPAFFSPGKRFSQWA
jgi:hypothetical protein